jgi:hypothetical protein
MHRTQQVLRSGIGAPAEIIDTLLLKFEDRVKQRGFVFGSKNCIDLISRTRRCCADDLLVPTTAVSSSGADVEQVLEGAREGFHQGGAAGLALGNATFPSDPGQSPAHAEPRGCDVARERRQARDGDRAVQPEGDSAHDHTAMITITGMVIMGAVIRTTAQNIMGMVMTTG